MACSAFAVSHYAVAIITCSSCCCSVLTLHIVMYSVDWPSGASLASA